MTAFSSTVSQANLKIEMTETSIQQSLLQFFRDQFSVDLPSTDTDLIEAGILDSLMLIDVVFFIEKEFSVTTELGDLEMENFVTIDNMARFVAERQPSSGQGDLDAEPAAAARSVG